MAHASVAPAEVSAASAKSSPSRYLEDATFGPLGSIDTTKTLIATLCGRGNDAAFNAKIIATTERLSPLVHALSVVFFAAGVSLALVSNPQWRVAVSLTTFVLGTALFAYIAASLSFDMLARVVRTFEFWFLLTVNATNLLLWHAMYPDIRSIAFLATGANYGVVLCTDANIHARRFTARLLVFASPGLMLVLLITVLHLAPDLTYPQYQFRRLDVDATDLLLNGTLTIAYFTAVRVFRNQHLVFSRAPVTTIECDMYFPNCHLATQAEYRRVTVESANLRRIRPETNCLELVQYPFARGIEATRTLVPCCRVSRPALLILGLVGLTSSVIGFARLTAQLDHLASPVYTVEAIAFGCSLAFWLVYVGHWQPTLAKRIVLEIDAWFVAFQATTVCVGASDALGWATRPTLLLATAWLWLLWILFLDAVPTATRRRLGCTHPFVALVILCLGAFPLAVAHWLYISEASHDRIHDRVLLHLRVDATRVLDFRVLGFLASKLATLWIWIGRFLWRELFRPTDAFKLIKRRVFYRVP